MSFQHRKVSVPNSSDEDFRTNSHHLRTNQNIKMQKNQQFEDNIIISDQLQTRAQQAQPKAQSPQSSPNKSYNVAQNITFNQNSLLNMINDQPQTRAQQAQPKAQSPQSSPNKSYNDAQNITFNQNSLLNMTNDQLQTGNSKSHNEELTDQLQAKSQRPKPPKHLLNYENVSLFPTSINSHLIDLSKDKSSNPCIHSSTVTLCDNLKSYVFIPYFQNEDALIFTSDSYPADWISSPYSIKKVVLFYGSHPNRSNWDYTSISCLLNELINFVNIPQRKNNKFVFAHVKNSTWKISVKIEEKILVKASLSWLIENSRLYHDCFISRKRKCIKLRTKYVLQEEHFFYFVIPNPKPVTSRILSHSSLMFYSIYDFSEAFHSFALKLIKNGLAENDDTFPILQYHDFFCNEDTEAVSDITTLKERINGYICFNITPVGERVRNYPKIMYKEKMHYIISGVYILPSAQSISLRNDINGYLLDATFRILPFFTTSILMASIYNTGMALGFAFSRTETEDAFNLLLDTIQEKCGVNFNGKIIETDQGSALMASIKLHNMIHLKCLRHLLKNLQKNIYCYHAKELIECCTKYEFDFTKKKLQTFFMKLLKKSEKILKLVKGQL